MHSSMYQIPRRNLISQIYKKLVAEPTKIQFCEWLLAHDGDQAQVISGNILCIGV